MKILLIADVHNRPNSSKRSHNKTLKGIANAISTIDCDLIVFLGDTVHGPDFQCAENYSYEQYLKEVLDLTNCKPFAYIFGNHDDECFITKDEILNIVNSYPNSLTKGRNFTVEMQGETLLFIDSGSYYADQTKSLYDVVDSKTIAWAKSQIAGKKAILFQHIIVPDVIDKCMQKSRGFTLSKKWVMREDGSRLKFNDGVNYIGTLGEYPCPPDINSGEFEQLAPNLKGAVFGHDHLNDFELDVDGVRVIQCAGSGYNCYDWNKKSSLKLLDTQTMTTKQIFI
jgi:predicted phosphodiesterase